MASSHPPDTEGSSAGVHAGSSVIGVGEQVQNLGDGAVREGMRGMVVGDVACYVD
jgi:hypothetical protein